MTESIGERLEYFQELEHATRMLNHPGESLVLQTDFLYMVERVDICIDFLRAHVRVYTIIERSQSNEICIATLQGGRIVSPALSTMHDPRDDPDQNVFRGVSARVSGRRGKTHVRKGWLTEMFHSRRYTELGY